MHRLGLTSAFIGYAADFSRWSPARSLGCLLLDDSHVDELARLEVDGIHLELRAGLRRRVKAKRGNEAAPLW